MALDTKFTMDELKVSREVPQIFGPPAPLFTTPISYKENMLRLYEGKTPMWVPSAFGDASEFMIACDPENQARSPEGGIDGYGVEWVFVKEVGGAMVKPGSPKITDISKWKECVTIPDPDTWDWEGFAKEQLPKLAEGMAVKCAVPGCLFERLIATMDFEGAIVALIDEEQQEYVHEFLRAITDVHKKTYSNLKKWFNPDIVNMNDDWGSQRAQFFANETYREMLFPYVKELADHVHSLGMYFDLHSCGFIEPLIPMIIEAGLDSWGGQPLNDKAKLKEMYDNGKFVFTAHIEVPMDATEEQMDAAIEEFINGIGSDNRCMVQAMGPPALKQKLYIATRKNYDKLLAEGKAIL